MSNILKIETIQFLIFVVLGVVFSLIFDFFRALRKVKKPNTLTVYIQDIIYFCIIGCILIFTMIKYIKESFRVYLLLSIILGIFIYIGVFGNIIFNLFQKVIKTYKQIIDFIFITLELPKQLCEKQLTFLKNFVTKCCKKMTNMINLKYFKFKMILKGNNILNKRGVINVKKSTKEIKKEI